MVDIGVNVVCSECGNDVTADYTGEINVDPCDHCLDKRHEEGRLEGLVEGE